MWSTTCDSRRCPPGSSATATTGSSGRDDSSRTGRPAWPRGSGTRCGSCRSGRRTPRWGRRRRWRCLLAGTSLDASPTQLRDLACAQAASDPPRALAIARSISDPCFRCQALSAVAEHVSDRRERHDLIREVLRVAGETGQPNRVVTVSVWPLRLLHVDREWDWLGSELDRLLVVISHEPHPTR